MACICALNIVAKAAVTGKVKVQHRQEVRRHQGRHPGWRRPPAAPLSPRASTSSASSTASTSREAQRYADVEITHGRIAMLAALGFLVGEQVEGSSFLFDSNVTGPAINHFQQVPGTFWGLLGAFVFTVEANRVQTAWQNPFDAEKLFLSRPTTPPETTTTSTPSACPRVRMPSGSTT
jgi:hypothetical protein